MSVPEKASIAERILRTGVLQRSAIDFGCLVGLALIGTGIYQLSRPATLIYAGVIVIAVCVLLVIDRRGRATAKEHSS